MTAERRRNRRAASEEGRTHWSRWLERVAWIGILAFIGFRVWPQAAAALGVGGTDGEKAPEVQVTTLSGRDVALSDLRGQVVLVNFWATWCPPCRLEMPGFQSVYEKYGDRGFTILGLSQDQGATGTVQSFLSERGITYPVAMGTAAAERAFGGVSALPTSILIDRRGRVRYRVTGIFAGPSLDRAVERLLDEPAAGAAGGR